MNETLMSRHKISVEKYIPKLVSDFNRGCSLDHTKTLALRDVGIMVPTPAGLPLSINVSTVGAATLKGTIQVEGITPESIWQILTGNRKPVFKIISDITPR